MCELKRAKCMTISSVLQGIHIMLDKWRRVAANTFESLMDSIASRMTTHSSCSLDYLKFSSTYFFSLQGILFNQTL